MFASIGTTYELDRHTNEGRRGSQTSENFKQSYDKLYIMSCELCNINLFKFFKNLISLIRGNTIDSSNLHIIN